jgi:hypothetical protein
MFPTETEFLNYLDKQEEEWLELQATRGDGALKRDAEIEPWDYESDDPDARACFLPDSPPLMSLGDLVAHSSAMAGGSVVIEDFSGIDENGQPFKASHKMTATASKKITKK